MKEKLPDRYVVIFNNRFWMRNESCLHPFDHSEWELLTLDSESVAELRVENNVSLALCILNSANAALLEQGEFVSLRSLITQVNDIHFGQLSRIGQVAYFLSTHRYCGRCGERMQRLATEIAVTCPKCELTNYPRISPSIIVAIRRGRQLLLARSARHPEGMWSVLAGFNEAGESLEQTLKREVMEEVGLEITNAKYFGSQSWPFPHSLMIGYTAEYLSGEIVIDDEEIVAANWFDIDALPSTPPQRSIAGKLIACTRELIYADAKTE